MVNMIVLCVTCYAFFGSVVVSGAEIEQEPAHEMLNAALWQGHSAEYLGAAHQAYRLAIVNLKIALADHQWSAALEQSPPFSTLPPAVIADIDETVLDNASYESRIILEHGSYSRESFRNWCEEAAASAVPGAKAFFADAVARGVTVFFYSARVEPLRGCTQRNLERLGLPVRADGSNLLLNDGTPKSAYRAQLARHYRILLLIGDSLEDFIEGSKNDSDSRRRIADQYQDRWGERWIVLPNAMYGHWEATMYGFDYRLPRTEMLRRKRRALRP